MRKHFWNAFLPSFFMDQSFLEHWLDCTWAFAGDGADFHEAYMAYDGITEV